MSINHYSSDQIPEPHFYMMDSSSPGQNPIFFSRLMPKIATTSRPTSDEHMVMSSADDGDSKSSSSLFLDLDQNQRREKEHLFEKPLTPSDVGKLNRLVIPKQHAEKYFPLGGGGGDGEGEKGFLLSFEDEAGKPWKFRYSYWNSSQSYVLTKGWSRFVKEKRLDAGDFVVFYRHLAEADRLFIGWRRRHSGEEGGGAQAVAGRGMFYNPSQNQMQVQGCSTSPSYQPECVHSGVFF
ncbi:hypothetical protein F511_44157 [Dorcoceras hygrometricum]|uniref:TF-B3 domain-containing protein n=1 Tax=Dorcoceras hygrometricum TaxID=472368 RepID=A0A2Z7A5J5_9LAMI|nr:hypothetical protein F511_44157 [Dorcoceras hygrometricum]